MSTEISPIEFWLKIVNNSDEVISNKNQFCVVELKCLLRFKFVYE